MAIGWIRDPFSAPTQGLFSLLFAEETLCSGLNGAVEFSNSQLRALIDQLRNIPEGRKPPCMRTAETALAPIGPC